MSRGSLNVQLYQQLGTYMTRPCEQATLSPSKSVRRGHGKGCPRAALLAEPVLEVQVTCGVDFGSIPGALQGTCHLQRTSAKVARQLLLKYTP